MLMQPDVVVANGAETEAKGEAENKYVLTYFDVDGIAASTRWAFAIGGIPFEDRRITGGFSEWLSLKPTIPGGVLPVLTIQNDDDDEIVLTESLAILIHVADKANLVPRDPIAYAHAYSVALTAHSYQVIMSGVYVTPPGDQKRAALELANTDTIPTRLHRLENTVKLHQSHQGYVVEDRLTFADLHVANILHNLLEHAWGLNVKNIPTNWPRVFKVYQLVMSHPAVQRSIKRQSPKPILHYFEFTGRAESIRQLCKYAKIDFEDVRVPRDQWLSDLKAQSLTGKMPFMEIGDQRIYEVIACLTYVAELADMMPKTTLGHAHALAIFSSYNNCRPFMRQIAVTPEPDKPTVLQDVRPKFAQELQTVEKLLLLHNQTASTHCVDNALTYIDFYLAYEIEWAVFRTILTQGWELDFPNIAKIHKFVTSLTS